MPAPLQPLDGHFVVQPHDHDLARARFVRAVHRDEIAIEDAGIQQRSSAAMASPFRVLAWT